MINNWAMPKGKTELNPHEVLVAGAGAGITALILTYPLEFVRCRLTVQKGEYFISMNPIDFKLSLEKHYTGILDCLIKVGKKDGIFALYRGLWPSIIGVIPYVGIDFAVYETLKRYSPKDENGHVADLVTVTNGAIAGLFAQTGVFISNYKNIYVYDSCSIISSRSSS